MSGDRARTHFGARQTTQTYSLRQQQASHVKGEKRVLRATVRILLALNAFTELKWLGPAVRDWDLKSVYRHADERVISQYSDQLDCTLGSDDLDHVLISVVRNPLGFE